MTDHPSSFDAFDSPQSPDWEAIARHVAGESTAESAARVDELLGDDTDRQLVASLQDISGRARAEIPSDLDVEAALGLVKSRMREAARPILRLEPIPPKIVKPSRSSGWRVHLPAIAAAGLLVVGLGTWLSYRTTETSSSVPRMVATGVGMRETMRLADGTKVVLGPLSSVKTEAGYGSTSRIVEIRGDAYFEVVHNAARPFTVQAGNATIQDVGTKFAVKSDDSGNIGVSVTEGSVTLAQKQSAAPPVVLKAGDQGTIETDGRVTAHRGAVTSDDMAWMNGRLVFRETSLSEVASELRRWYGIDLQLADSSMGNRHLTATFSGEPPERVLDVLRLALGAEIERRGDTAIVRPAKGRAP
jgi:transmembrane sensor